MGELVKYEKKSSMSDEIRMAKFLSLPVRDKEPGDYRWHVNHIRVGADGSGVSTDGHRLHWVDRVLKYGTPLTPGWYSLVKYLKGGCWWEYADHLSEHDFPGYDDLLTVHEPATRDKTFTLEFTYAGLPYTYATIIRAMESNIIDPRYLQDLCDVLDSGALVRLWDTEHRSLEIPEKMEVRTEKPIRVDIQFVNGVKGVGLIMPLR